MFIEASNTDLWNNDPLQICKEITTQHRVHTSCEMHLVMQRNGVIYIYSRSEYQSEIDSKRYGVLQ